MLVERSLNFYVGVYGRPSGRPLMVTRDEGLCCLCRQVRPVAACGDGKEEVLALCRLCLDDAIEALDGT